MTWPRGWKADFPELEIVLNGGIKTLEACHEHLQTFDGVMLGREAYHNPYLLAEVDQQLFWQHSADHHPRPMALRAVAALHCRSLGRRWRG